MSQSQGHSSPRSVDIGAPDRELLELAARAYGIAKPKVQDGEGWMDVRYGYSQAVYDEQAGEYWNPLESDGDALRLAVKLRLFLDLDHLCALQPDGNRWWGGGEDEQAGMAHDECDPYAATRRAIVRAAAAIGRAM